MLFKANSIEFEGNLRIEFMLKDISKGEMREKMLKRE
jgi:hypothetical protein